MQCLAVRKIGLPSKYKKKGGHFAEPGEDVLLVAKLVSAGYNLGWKNDEGNRKELRQEVRSSRDTYISGWSFIAGVPVYPIYERSWR